MKRNAFKSAVLMAVFLAAFLCAGAGAVHAQTVWLVCTWDTSSVWKGADGRQKFERRFYVSDLMSMTTQEFLKVDRNGHRIEGLCGDYLDNTVNKAATERGEHLDSSGELKIIRNIELSGEDAGSNRPYNYAPKEKIAQKREEMIKDGKDAGRIIYNFNWDVTGKNQQADFENEMKRSSPMIGPTSSKSGQP